MGGSSFTHGSLHPASRTHSTKTSATKLDGLMGTPQIHREA
jgi:hypothetical protein